MAEIVRRLSTRLASKQQLDTTITPREGRSPPNPTVPAGDATVTAEDSAGSTASPGTSGAVPVSGASQRQEPTAAETAKIYLESNRDSCISRWRTFTRCEKGNSNMAALCERLGVQPMEIDTSNDDDCQLLEFLTLVAENKEKLSHDFNTAEVKFQCQSADFDSVVAAAFKVLHYQTGGYLKLRVRTDGQLAKNQDPVKKLDILEISPGGIVNLRRNGNIECPMWEMADVGPRDCIVVALNNAIGHGFYTRDKLAAIDPDLKFGDMPVDKIKNAMEQTSPYTGVVCKSFTNNFEVFRQREGIYLIVAALILKNKTQQNHAIAFDAYRDIVNFGLNDNQFPMTFRIEKKDRTDVSYAKDNLLQELSDYSADINDIKIFHVIRMQVKVKALKHAHEPAYTIQKPTSKDMVIVCVDDGAGVFPKGTPEYDEKRKTQPKSKARSASAIITESPPESSKKARIE
jgi:hypothetical protein